jgi:hypothetical protein
MTPEMILATIKSGFEFGSEFLKFLQTEQGKKVINQMLDDRTKWDAFWAKAPEVLKKFFTGEYFK